jgi:hypothetical protein
VESSCELGNEPSGSMKCWGNYRVAAQLVASRVALSSTELGPIMDALHVGLSGHFLESGSDAVGVISVLYGDPVPRQN